VGNVKTRELANHCAPDPDALGRPLRTGLGLIRRHPTLALSFLRHASLTYDSNHIPRGSLSPWTGTQAPEAQCGAGGPGRPRLVARPGNVGRGGNDENIADGDWGASPVGACFGMISLARHDSARRETDVLCQTGGRRQPVFSDAS
jgi:hypothetical protein